MKQFLIFYVLSISTAAFGTVIILNSFSAGEISPQLEGHVEQVKYYQGCRTLENMVAIPHGSAIKRPGCYYIADANNITNVRIIPFNYSVETAYILELGHGYLRFFKEAE